MNCKILIPIALSVMMASSYIPTALADDALQDSIDAKTETLLLFEDNFNDEKGDNTPNVVGTSPTFAEGQSGKGAVFKTNGGYLDFTNYIGSGTSLKNKSISFSLKSNKLHDSYDPAILSNTNWDKVDTAGFTFAYEYNSPGNYKARISNTSSSQKADATKMTYSAQTWQNYVISFDDTNSKMLIYCDGELIRTLDYADYGSELCENTKHTLKLGNDGTGSYSKNKTVDYSFVVDNFMVTNKLLTDEEIAYINETHPGPQPTFEMSIKSVNAANIAADGYVNFNLYSVGETVGNIAKTEFDVTYDPTVLTYDRAQFNNATITEVESGKLHISTTKTPADIKKYSESRITQLVFRTADVNETTATEFGISNGAAYSDDDTELENVTVNCESTSVNVHAKNALDLNQDGVIGVGDISLTDDDETKAEIADAAKIYPYKRAIAITVDGAGRAWADNAVYNGKGIDSGNNKLEGEGLANVRKNPYCLDMFNNQMAISTSAESMDPPISAQNYCSILHGITFKKLPSAYQFTNDIANAKQWPDYVLETRKYPSMLKSMNEIDPSRKLFAYAEWHPITNGVLEQNSGAYVDYQYGSYCFDRIAQYIKDGKMKNTAIAYMQSDVMDHYGHSYGYFTDGYYELLNDYDAFFKTLNDALKEENLFDDTLIVVNADHGGHNYWNTTNNRMQGTHGTYSNMDDRGIFIALGGQTVKKGAKLTGGTNDDIAAVIYNGLRLDKPVEMTDSDVFDQKAFLSQEELSKTGRDIEKVTATENGNTFSLDLTAKDKNIKAAEFVIDTPFEISDITLPEGVSVLSKKYEDGKWTVVFDFANTPEKIGDIVFNDETKGHVKIEEAMLAAADGSEIYCDIENNVTEVKAENIIEKLMPYGDVAYSDYNDTVSNGFKFKSNSDELSETDLTGFADVAYDGGIKITKKVASKRLDLESTFTSSDEFNSERYTLEFDIEQINAAPMYIATKWRNYITINWTADGNIDINAGKASLTGYKNKRVKFRIEMDYTKQYFDIYANDELVVSKCALRDDAAGSNSPSKPSTFNINITDAGAVGSGMKLYNLSLTEYYSDTYKITDENGYIVTPKGGDKVMAIADKSLYKEGAKLYIATYDKDGLLSGVKSADMSSVINTSTDTLEVPEGGNVKAFLWDNTLKPIE